MIQIYTDGSCIKDKFGGYAYLIFYEDKTKYSFSKGTSDTTNNREEMKAIIEALKKIKDEKSCKIYTDSQLVLNCAQKNWKRNKNLDLWKIYDEVSKDKEIEFEWIKAHNGNIFNEIVDKLARNAAEEMKNYV